MKTGNFCQLHCTHFIPYYQRSLTSRETSANREHIATINPLSPNSDQQQFSPNNIHMLPREIVMRVNTMITKEKML